MALRWANRCGHRQGSHAFLSSRGRLLSNGSIAAWPGISIAPAERADETRRNEQMLPTNRTVAKETITELDLESRVSIESQITDARVERLDFSHVAAMDTRLESYAVHCAWRTYLFSFLGSLQGKVILDIACGYSMTPVIFA